jgi:glycosyltransferase involved in cell wall biosynthesis
MTNYKASKEKFAFFLPGLYDGGAERIMLNLAKGISERGYPVDMVLGRAEGPFMSDVPASVRVIDLKASRVVLSTPALLKYLRGERPTALLSVLYANIVALWSKRLAGYPFKLVIAEHNTLSSVAKGEKDARLQIYPLMARMFYPWSDGIVAVSMGVADDLAEQLKLAHSRVKVIYNPIVTPELFQKARMALDHPWFKPGEPPVLLAIGRLTAQKGFDMLIRAFSEIRKSMKVRLVILGEGEERAALEAQIHSLGLADEISLPGFVANPYQYIAGAALFVLSSRWEGLPTVLVEAMALGIPIVSTDCPSGPREILLDGKYGALVPVEEPAALANAIISSLANKKDCPPEESWAPFTLDAVVNQYIEILSSN